MKEIVVIGGGLAGVEAAWQAAAAGRQVRLYEMRPVRPTPAHRTDKLAEIVCSNSLKSDEPGTASYLLKEELRRADSLVMQAAAATRVPAGAALAVDREKFAGYITEKIRQHPRIELVREEVTCVPDDQICIIATGPLSSEALTAEIMELTGSDQLYFYDAIAPIVAADSIDTKIAFRAARYDKGGDDYLNCPFDEAQYARFYEALVTANSVPLQRFEETRWFEACLPIEEAARRGVHTLRFGPMKPVGLADPSTGREPYAVVQLRQENLLADAYSLVGFQNHLRYGEQARVLRLIPGLEQAEFLQYGQIHRNTYICSPRVLDATMQMRERPPVFFAGQITGVEGYVESVAMGWLAGVNAALLAAGRTPVRAPNGTAIGALAHYVSSASVKNFQPINITFALLPPLTEQQRKRFRRKRDRRNLQVELALKEWDRWLHEIDFKSHISDLKSQISGSGSEVSGLNPHPDPLSPASKVVAR
ncbi:MAG TPA: methylenetetrahydrofolate--tRNA-(uracil(54)-C(5))-methyltransferase (FADH(2)-oxidizing) TrmFO [Pyrinomonadaceae bacterium]|nr:methylenetetrahydrofolate--tRNA-(uracil(54)-C(5))-methyltransferase (FADH(2)-oxidizing) TrmFO [Pyrinomonadaceae bacterium]